MVRQRPRKFIDRAIELLQIPESEQEVTIKNGQSRVRNQVQGMGHGAGMGSVLTIDTSLSLD